MANKEKYTKQYILERGVDFVKENGIEILNSRNFAKYMELSTQPIFRNYPNMQTLKEEIFQKCREEYLNYIINNIDEENYLVTMLYSIIMFAKHNPQIYKMIFYSGFRESRTIEEINNSIWNERIINKIMEQYTKSKEESQKIYRDVRFYTHGIAIQLSTKAVIIEDNEIKCLIKNIINKLLN